MQGVVCITNTLARGARCALPVASPPALASQMPEANSKPIETIPPFHRGQHWGCWMACL